MRLALLLVAACGSAPQAPTIASRTAGDTDRCAMVEAAFQLDQLKKFACGNVATRDHRILVDVDILPRFAPGERCSSSVFAIYQQNEPVNTDALLQLVIGTRDQQTWNVSAEFVDPPNSPDDEELPGGGWDSSNYYCAFMGGHLVRTNGVWRSWFDFKD